MIRYYYNPKTEDLIIFDPEGEMLVLGRLKVRVLVGPDVEVGMKERDNDLRGQLVNTGKTRGKRKPGQCSNCGEVGHRKDSCKKTTE